MLMGARPNSRRQTNLNHQDPHPAAHGSHLTANKVPNSRERSRFRGIEESDGTTEIRQEGGKKTKQEGKCLSLTAPYCVTRESIWAGRRSTDTLALNAMAKRKRNKHASPDINKVRAGQCNRKAAPCEKSASVIDDIGSDRWCFKYPILPHKTTHNIGKLDGIFINLLPNLDKTEDGDILNDLVTKAIPKAASEHNLRGCHKYSDLFGTANYKTRQERQRAREVLEKSPSLTTKNQYNKA
ncbi:hypothetical protein ElyMa_000075800 [Elysia marginata]|uniref:Uncharacterized protein n=1 Tax=Elysia marginata TaxID=1093978 RepID=A0AAV4EHN9_9GAST|nr:hypothetical protein ElyMa_000075800 [Elysia marginata]